MNGNNITEEKALEERAKFIGAFNGTMIDIWKEKIVDMDIIDTGSLLDSVAALPVRADGRFSEVVLVQCFLEYGLWQDYGTGREVWRGPHIIGYEIAQLEHRGVIFPREPSATLSYFLPTFLFVVRRFENPPVKSYRLPRVPNM